LAHLGAPVVLTADPGVVRDAVGVVLPGVGHFGACMAALRAAGLDDLAREAARSGRPFLGVCIGMQMLFEGSDEAPGVAGLGVLAGRVTKLPATVKLPQIGWNTLEPVPGSALLAGLPDPAWLYFVHSFAPETDESIVAAWCDYGRRFAAAVERGNLWATQFHPEKSGDAGLRLLANFVALCATGGVAR
jgi:imidazole glycerol phosphate synthase, glutamine amidotransferase subunit